MINIIPVALAILSWEFAEKEIRGMFSSRHLLLAV
jgi:hypothetical protein